VVRSTYYFASPHFFNSLRKVYFIFTVLTCSYSSLFNLLSGHHLFFMINHLMLLNCLFFLIMLFVYLNSSSPSKNELSSTSICSQVTYHFLRHHQLIFQPSLIFIIKLYHFTEKRIRRRRPTRRRD